MAYSTIDKSSLYQNQVLYTGDDSTQSITGVGFQPDLWWNKSRSGTHSAGVNCLYDAVRGVTNRLQSNSTAAEATISGVTAFGADGVTLGSENQSNGGSTDYVGWNWKANGSGSLNEVGSIDSTVSANTTSGFSICTFTTSATGADTIGHGLGVAPSVVIAKTLNSVNGWFVYHKALGNTKMVRLNATSVEETNTMWNDTTPTSTVFSLMSDNIGTTKNCVAYCFAEVPGYSKFSSYIGNGNADGTFIYTGFKPSFIMTKRFVAGTDNWQNRDNARDPYNLANHFLKPNAVLAEGVADGMDYLSNGFKYRASAQEVNGFGYSYIYLAFGQPIISNSGVCATAR